MIEFIKYILRNIIPYTILNKITRFRIELLIRKYQPKILQYLKDNLTKYDSQDKINEIINFIEHNQFSIFPYDFIYHYNSKEIVVYTDDDVHMKYVLYNRKRLYFPRTWGKERIQDYYNGILMEQDTESPHRYESSEIYVKDGDIVVDIGCAEGIFALSVIERAKTIYLFECSREWIKALEMTFAPWTEKINIINAYLGDVTENNTITLDNLFEGKNIDFIKADIEGSEPLLLKGAKNILAKSKLRIVLCAYHNANDEQDIVNTLSGNNFKIEFSNGYMLYIYDKKYAPPYIRRGVVRAIK